MDKRLRITLNYNGKYHPIFWQEIKKDGNIYLGPRYKNINLIKKLSKKLESGETEMKIYYNEGEQIKYPRLLKTSKISFHASGRIHYAGDHLLSKPLRILKEQHELCIVLFCHPAKYGIDKVKPHDIVLDYTGDESKPIIAQIFVAPHEKAKVVSHPTAENQIHLVFEVNRLHNIPDHIIQILLIEPVPGPWPPNTYILFGHKAISQDNP